ncbi:MAG TPA: SURF1 family cytochrome oxidase biogenesis protein [Sphingomonadaceae bacterium]|nr:SURF1 family cytochrome oxidase biogenesis protein [Sphingomonadaceae bacterium]
MLAVATMVGLGVWQLQRAGWKEGLMVQLAANRGLPVIAYPADPRGADDMLFRQATAVCARPTTIRANAGRDVGGTSGWSHLATCLTNGRGDMVVDIGWSPGLKQVAWAGGPVTGVIVPDSKAGIRLVASNPAPGLVASQPPGPETIPNNHRMYALQWFFFAASAAAIYGLALRRRGHKATA